MKIWDSTRGLASEKTKAAPLTRSNKLVDFFKYETQKSVGKIRCFFGGWNSLIHPQLVGNSKIRQNTIVSLPYTDVWFISVFYSYVYCLVENVVNMVLYDVKIAQNVFKSPCVKLRKFIQ